jgi:POT family proton-dependent oligopeptide transporter
MILGNLIIAFSPLHFLFGNYTFIGTGFFKPNISSMVGELYKVGDSRRDAGFGLFYSGNIGALLGGAVCVYLGTSPDYGWSYAFLSSAGYGYWFYYFLITKHSLGPIGDSPLLDQTSSKEQLKRLLFM